MLLNLQDFQYVRSERLVNVCGLIIIVNDYTGRVESVDLVLRSLP